MGNTKSCCSYSSPQPVRKTKETPAFEEHLPEGELSTNNLQHISERELGDIDTGDPSCNPSAKTMFLERSKQSVDNNGGVVGSGGGGGSGGGITRKRSQYQIASQSGALKKSSSCSTIYLDVSGVFIVFSL